MSNMRKKLEQFVEEEAAKYVIRPWVEGPKHSFFCGRDFKAGAHLLLDAVVEMHDLLEMSRRLMPLSCPSGRNTLVEYLDSFEKRLSVNTEKRGEG